jgi:hypothetical protein
LWHAIDYQIGSICAFLSNIVKSAREKSLVRIVTVGGLIVRCHLSIVVLGVLHKVIAVDPVVEHEDMVTRQKNGIALLHLTAVNASANVLNAKKASIY